MSSAMAIAAVTHVIKDMIGFRVATSDVAGLDPQIWSLPLDKVEERIDNENVINLFMYRTTHNQGWRNEDLPSRVSSGEERTRPKLCLDLYYMLSCYGTEDLYGEMMLGYAMQILHNNPALSRSFITDQLAALAGANMDGVRNSELADQIELIKIIPDNVNTEELSRLWTSFSAKYRLSTFYKASVVLIESEQPDRVAIPVKKPMLYVKPFRQATITFLKSRTSLTSSSEDILLIRPGNLLEINGNSLLGDTTHVTINGSQVNTVGNPSNVQIVVALPLDLNVGIHSVQIIHFMELGEPATDHKGSSSNVEAFVLNPQISNIQLNGNSISLDIASPILADQKVSLLLNELVPEGENSIPGSFKFEFDHDADVAAGNIAIPINDIDEGAYLVRLQVDKFVSPLPDDVSTHTVNIP